MAIHPHALVSPDALIDEDVHIGPFSIVEPGAVIGRGCRIAARVSIKSGVRLGEGNEVGEGSVLGGAPQHLAPPPNPGGLVIGDRNIIRENATLHRAMKAGDETRLGNDCLLMVGAHMAHDSTVEDHTVLTNNVLLAGHVHVGERAYLGGAVAVHQFCRVGRLAMIGGLARITQDVPPFVMIDGDSNLVVGLNRVGLRRAGFDHGQVRGLKGAYQVIYRSGLSFDERLAELTERFGEGPASEYAEFFRGGSRGFVRERRSPPGATIRPLHDAVADRSSGDSPLKIANGAGAASSTDITPTEITQPAKRAG